MTTTSHGAISLLADGRFPAGGHAHSGGYEATSASYELQTPATIDRFLRGRLTTTGQTDAALIAAIHHRLGSDAASLDWREIDNEIEARIASPALRATSRTLGRQWLRAGRRVWPDPTLDHLGVALDNNPHHVAAFASVAHVAALSTLDAVAIHLHHLIAGVTTAAVRLHGLDPYQMQGIEVGLLPLADRICSAALETVDHPIKDLPAASSPLQEILAEQHRSWDLRLFQS